MLVRVSRSRAMPVGDRRSTSPRFNADRRYAVRSSEIGRAALLVRVSRSRAMPVGDRRSTSPRFNADRRYAVRSSEIGGAQRCWCGFRAHARCRSETGAPARRYAIRRSRDWRGARCWCGFARAHRRSTCIFNAELRLVIGTHVERGATAMTNRLGRVSPLTRAAGAQGRSIGRVLPPSWGSAGRSPDGAPTPSRTTRVCPVGDARCRSEAPTGRTGRRSMSA